MKIMTHHSSKMVRAGGLHQIKILFGYVQEAAVHIIRQSSLHELLSCQMAADLEH
jgi:hypothetical protein